MTLRPMSALAAIVLFSAVAHAGAADALIAAINHCAAIADDGQRHSCYDKLPAVVQSLTPVVSAETAARPADPPAAANSETPEGLTDLFATPKVPATHIAATVESFTFDYGVFVVTLDNGQVWRQVAAVGDIVHLNRSRKDRVMIWRDDFGNEVLKIEGYQTKYHVRRIK